jgi:hypothetical protein
MAYKCKDPREGEEIIWFRVKSEVKTTALTRGVRESWDLKMKDLGLKVGAITWSDKNRYDKYSTATEMQPPRLLPEDNRHGIDFKLECFEEIPDPRVEKARYTYSDPKGYADLVWLRVISTDNLAGGGFHAGLKKLDLQVGDITWVDGARHKREFTDGSGTALVEGNRHSINFDYKAFEIIPDPRVKKSGYTYKKPDKDVIWVMVISKVVAPCRGFKGQLKMADLKIGDVSWIRPSQLEGNSLRHVIHLESNRHGINFDSKCFEVISPIPSSVCPNQVDLAYKSFEAKEDEPSLGGISRTYPTTTNSVPTTGSINDYIWGTDSSDNPESKLGLKKEEKLDRDFTPMNNIN